MANQQQNNQQGKVNLNSAPEREIRGISSIGNELADRIIEHRDQNGGFKDWQQVDDLFQIGDTRMQKLQQEATL